MSLFSLTCRGVATFGLGRLRQSYAVHAKRYPQSVNASVVQARVMITCIATHVILVEGWAFHTTAFDFTKFGIPHRWANLAPILSSMTTRVEEHLGGVNLLFRLWLVKLLSASLSLLFYALSLLFCFFGCVWHAQLALRHGDYRRAHLQSLRLASCKSLQRHMRM